MSELFNLTIDGVKITAEKGTTILNAARANGIFIPTLCNDDCVDVYGACGLCVVEADGIPKLLRACSATVMDGMVVNTKSDRVIRSRKIALELLLSDHDGDCKAPCSLNCPAGTDCQGYVGLIANGEFDAALRLIKEKIALPASIGRICPHPCEKNCRRDMVEEPISIAHLKSFAGDRDLNSEKTYKPNIMPETGKTVSVIGGGPGGLSAAYYLRLRGHKVKVYDMMPNMGGMLRYGIPEYRLPKKIVDAEVQLIADTGVELINNVKIGKDISFDEIRKNSDAVVVAIGAWKSLGMRVPGENLEGVYGGIDFLRETVLGNPPKIGDKVAVCGGGNTAMDACRTAVRLGAKEVYVVYRRTRNEMPAEKIEIEEAEEEGVVFKFLTNPAEILSKDNKVSGMKLQVMELGEPDASGRRSPVPVEGKFEYIDLDSVIMAIGQGTVTDGFDGLELTKKNTIVADEGTFMTSIEGVFAVGDATNKGASIAVEAIGEADKAVNVIDAYLNGSSISYKKPYVVERDVTPEMLADKEKAPRIDIETKPAEVRKCSFEETVIGYSDEAAMEEAKRCLECGCREYFKCKLLKYANMYDVNPAKLAGEKKTSFSGNSNEFIVRNPDKCVLCGLCVRSCSQVMDIHALGLIGRGFTTVVSSEFNLPLDQTRCNNCGLCVKLCPTGALTERSTLSKQVPLDEIPEIIECPLCEKKCSLEVTSYNGKRIRVIPDDDCSRNCHLGRQELIKKILEL